MWAYRCDTRVRARVRDQAGMQQFLLFAAAADDPSRQIQDYLSGASGRTGKEGEEDQKATLCWLGAQVSMP